MNEKTKVLIVEDDLPLAMLMVSTLTRFNCDVTVACAGQKAMKIAAEKTFDLITLDISLPDTTGFEICRQLKERHISYQTPVIFISASPCQQDIDEAKKYGAVDFVAKPFTVGDFIPRLLSHLQPSLAHA